MNDQGAPPAADVRHAVLLYQGQREFVAAAGHFASGGVQAREAVLVVATGTAIGLLQARLAFRSGQVSWADLAIGGGNPRRILALIWKFAAEHRGRPVRVVRQAGDMSRPPDELREAMRCESLLSLARGPAQVLCGYDRRLGGQVAGCAEPAHPILVRDGQWRQNDGYAGPGTLPAECDHPLPPPPASAAVLTFRRDLARVRQVVTDQARLAGLDLDRIADLVLAVGELAANTLAHTDEPGLLTAWCTAGEVICQVDDTGQIGDPLAGIVQPATSVVAHSWGLWVVNQVCDLVETRSGPSGTTIRVHMRRGFPAAAPGRVS